MKKILIIGSNSYIGTSFKEYMAMLDCYRIDAVSASDGSWREFDFSGYNVVLHLAGLVHRKEKNDEALYNEINCDLAIEIAQKARENLIEQFIFMSTASVYGKSKYIDALTVPSPQTYYGKSKYRAEKLIENLETKKFKVAIIRPPMVYGKNCPGNFLKLVQLVQLTPFFPNVQNKRSMIYIENLCEFIKQIIDKEGKGCFHPQNNQYVETLRLSKCIAHGLGKKLIALPGLSFLRNKKINNIKYINQLFGDFCYDMELSNWDDIEYNIVNFEDSIKKCIIKRE